MGGDEKVNISKMWIISMIFLELFLEMLDNKLDVSLKGCKE